MVTDVLVNHSPIVVVPLSLVVMYYTNYATRVRRKKISRGISPPKGVGRGADSGIDVLLEPIAFLLLDAVMVR